MPRKIFVNLPVRDLSRSKEFFGRLGFEFDPRFTDDKAACMVISEEAHVMLIVEPFFRTFTKRAICDAATHAEGIYAVSCESRAEVDRLVRTAVAAGGRHALEPTDHGFMYEWSFLDPDGHQWGPLWMAPEAVQGRSG